MKHRYQIRVIPQSETFTSRLAFHTQLAWLRSIGWQTHAYGYWNQARKNITLVKRHWGAGIISVIELDYYLHLSPFTIIS